MLTNHSEWCQMFVYDPWHAHYLKNNFFVLFLEIKPLNEMSIIEFEWKQWMRSTKKCIRIQDELEKLKRLSCMCNWKPKLNVPNTSNDCRSASLNNERHGISMRFMNQCSFLYSFHLIFPTENRSRRLSSLSPYLFQRCESSLNFVKI